MVQCKADFSIFRMSYLLGLTCNMVYLSDCRFRQHPSHGSWQVTAKSQSCVCPVNNDLMPCRFDQQATGSFGRQSGCILQTARHPAQQPSSYVPGGRSVSFATFFGFVAVIILLRLFHFTILIPPKGGWGCLMFTPILESQGCHSSLLAHVLFFCQFLSLSSCFVFLPSPLAWLTGH